LFGRPNKIIPEKEDRSGLAAFRAKPSATRNNGQQPPAAARREANKARSEVEEGDNAEILSDWGEDEDLRSMVGNFMESWKTERLRQSQVLPVHLQVYEDRILNLTRLNQENINEYLTNIGVTPFQIRCMALRIRIEAVCKRARVRGKSFGEQIRRLPFPEHTTTIDGSRPGCKEIRRRIKKAHSITCDNMHWAEGRDYSGNFRFANGKDPADILSEVEYLLRDGGIEFTLY
jgi:hypothetical protein